MNRKCEFRFRYRGCIPAIFITLAFTLSFLSCLDCFFVRVDVGFAPDNSYFEKTTFGLGLWTFENPLVSGKCINPAFVTNVGGITIDDELYASFFSNGDPGWGIARLLAALGLLTGFALTIFQWMSICLHVKTNIQLIVTAVLTTITVSLEGSKIGLFFETEPCTAADFWERIDADEVSTHHKADTCHMDRGAQMSTASLTIYSIVIVYTLLCSFYPAREHQNVDTFDYDDVSLPSYLGSLGKSINSKFSKTSSKASSKFSAAKSQFSGASAKSNASSARGNSIALMSSIMSPIIEES